MIADDELPKLKIPGGDEDDDCDSPLFRGRPIAEVMKEEPLVFEAVQEGFLQGLIEVFKEAYPDEEDAEARDRVIKIFLEEFKKYGPKPN